jgi:hypothetical protein
MKYIRNDFDGYAPVERSLIISKKRQFRLTHYYRINKGRYVLRFQGVSKDGCGEKESILPFRPFLWTFRNCTCEN